MGWWGPEMGAPGHCTSHTGLWEEANWETMQVEEKVLGLAGKQCSQAPTATMLSSLPLLGLELAMCEECTWGSALQVAGTSGLQ